MLNKILKNYAIARGGLALFFSFLIPIHMATNFSTSVAFADDASTDTLSNVALFSRCYQHITQHHLQRTHPLRAQVLSGAIAPIDACMQVLQEGTLISSGANVGLLVNDTTEARSVLKTFNDLHRSWIGTDRVLSVLPSLTGSSALLYDESEPALYTTRALFSSAKIPYSDVLTNSSGMQALRDPLPSTTPQPATFTVTSFDTRVAPTTVNTIQVGTLKGVRSYSENPDQLPFNISMLVDADFNFPVYLRRNQGAGAIANGDYFLMNSGFTHYQTNDGGLSMPRRWSRAVYNDFLCRDVPTIRASDAEAYVIPHPVSTTPSFRKQVSCMQCHASLDQMAGTIRNVVNIDDSSDHPWTLAQSIPVWAGTQTTETITGSYNGSTPIGQFIFRSYDGTLNVKSLVGVGDLGLAITATQDYYSCVASRYLTFFTGITVNWADIGDPAVAANASQIAQDPNRAFAIQLGQHLQKSQSLMKLIEEILRSNVYSTHAMRN